MQRSRLNAIRYFALAALLSVPALGANPAQPGTINYVEGQVSIADRTLDTESVGSAQLQAGQSLTTENGKAEILLTPGVFLRIADNSSVTMVSPGLADTEVRVGRGRAMVEVAEIHKENNLLIQEGGATARLEKTGLYDFDSGRNQIRVFDGQAMVRTDDQEIKLKGGRELNLNGPPKAQKFDKKGYEDSFYRWASLRSDYLAEANVDAARSYRGDSWVGSGWYWSPWYGAYTFVPANGSFYSPFGWSYYSPWQAYGVPFGYYGRTFPRFNHNFHFRSRRLSPARR